MGRCDSGWEPRIAEQDYQSFLGFCVFVSLSLSVCSLVCEKFGRGAQHDEQSMYCGANKNNFRKTNLLGMKASGCGPRCEGGARGPSRRLRPPQPRQRELIDLFCFFHIFHCGFAAGKYLDQNEQSKPAVSATMTSYPRYFSNIND